jgi:hypothetical protein
MTDVDGKCGRTVRIVVKLRPDQYDELVRHVSEMKEGAFSHDPHSQQSE